MMAGLVVTLPVDGKVTSLLSVRASEQDTLRRTHIEYMIRRMMMIVTIAESMNKKGAISAMKTQDIVIIIIILAITR